MPRSLRYDEPYLLDERAASPIRHSGIRWGIGLVRFRRILAIAGCSSESWLTTQPSRSPGEFGIASFDPLLPFALNFCTV